ncbi:LysR family transcriptional regulator [Leucothrix sargassi]|nr:LysR family transcriptional regulator [Leucothrix sargassi]
MDIAHLKTFLEIYRIRHFGKSAEILCITQSAASARIKLLEERLGVKLFTRDRHAIEPTPAGHRFHKYAEMTVSGWEQARLMIALPERYNHSLSIGYLPDAWHLFLKHWMDDIQRHIPETALNMTIHAGQNVQELILGSALDIGFVFESVNSPRLTSVKITSLVLQLFSNQPNMPLLEAVSDGYIMVDWGARFEYEHSKAFPYFPGASLRTNYGVMALDLLREGKRSAYLPSQFVNNNLENQTLYPVEGAPSFERHLYAVYRTASESAELIEMLLEQIMTLSKAEAQL